ncbi:hypothetical protein AB1K89_09265 [Sporosarcina sp. 179-K 8C2 HS]|uniref:hypothetical protein n=1 Tax=Sporosarcina sp. 179-K 8C2 HS TaxID=3142387 RepID=UPI00399FF03E
MKLKLSLAAFFLSVSALLLQSTSFSTAEIKNDVVISVVAEDDALIAITGWEGRIFILKNNTDDYVDIENIMVMGGDSLGVDGYFSTMAAGEARVFTLIGEAPELSGKEIWITASWESGRADITSMIPPFVEEVNECTDQSKVNEVIVDEEVVEDTSFQEPNVEEVDGCTEQSEEDEASEEADGEVEEGEEKIDEGVGEAKDEEKDVEVVGEGEMNGNSEEGGEVEVEVDEESVNQDSTEEDANEETIIIEENNLPKAEQTESVDDSQ